MDTTLSLCSMKPSFGGLKLELEDLSATVALAALDVGVAGLRDQVGGDEAETLTELDEFILGLALCPAVGRDLLGLVLGGHGGVSRGG